MSWPTDAKFKPDSLTSGGDDKDKAAVYLADCRKLGITVLPPDVNRPAMYSAG